MKSHPWHDVDPITNSLESFQAIIEISRGSKAKYEVDKASGLLRLDRVLHASFTYPINYGFIPQTYAGDGDPLDILVLSQIDIEPLSIVTANVIGVLRMIDKGVDDKIISVCTHDVAVNQISSLHDLPQYLKAEIQHFFEQYKKLEHSDVVVEEWFGKEEAIKIIQQNLQDYREQIAPTLV
ncbi:MAG: inorganic diphosphatase [Bacteroidetes bacterium]|nr:inorganic diphosphatase [Bacteroidota bacterium]